MFTLGVTYDENGPHIPNATYWALGAFVVGVALSQTRVPDRTRGIVSVGVSALSIFSAFAFGSTVGRSVVNIMNGVPPTA